MIDTNGVGLAALGLGGLHVLLTEEDWAIDMTLASYLPQEIDSITAINSARQVQDITEDSSVFPFVRRFDKAAVAAKSAA